MQKKRRFIAFVLILITLWISIRVIDPVTNISIYFLQKHLPFPITIKHIQCSLALPMISINHLTMHNPKQYSSPYCITIDQGSCYFNINSFILQAFCCRSLAIKGATIHIIRNSDGCMNLLDMYTSLKKSLGTNKEAPGTPAFIIKQLSLVTTIMLEDYHQRTTTHQPFTLQIPCTLIGENIIRLPESPHKRGSMHLAGYLYAPRRIGSFKLHITHINLDTLQAPSFVCSGVITISQAQFFSPYCSSFDITQGKILISGRIICTEGILLKDYSKLLLKLGHLEIIMKKKQEAGKKHSINTACTFSIWGPLIKPQTNLRQRLTQAVISTQLNPIDLMIDLPAQGVHNGVDMVTKPLKMFSRFIFANGEEATLEKNGQHKSE